jgi:phosphoserine phosphatase RsbU/P
VTPGNGFVSADAEELFEDAPCGYLETRLDGTILRVNRTFEALTGFDRHDLVGARRFSQLLAPGARIYHETHFAPLLRMQGWVREIALELVCADGSRVPALVNAAMHGETVRTIVFAASDRRSYEQELVAERRREREIAQRLQASLLTGELPSGPAFELGVSYRPGVRGLAVGGDWYDAFSLGAGDAIALVVGDVVGRGIGAAATMGQLRSALRALAAAGRGPARALEALDDYAERHDVGRIATVAYAELSPTNRELHFACAGHPPPLLFGSAEGPLFAWEGRSVPLATHGNARQSRAEACRTLAEGGGVVFYSDGLIERRSRPISQGLDALRTFVAARSSETAPALATALTGALHAAEEGDDACVLIAKLAGPGPASHASRG